MRQMATGATGPEIALDGARKARVRLTGQRIRWMIAFLLLAFAMVGGRLIQLASVSPDTTIEGQERDLITATRPAILDRNGIEMAVDIRVPSLFAEPRRIIDVEEAVNKLAPLLPDLSREFLRDRLTGDKGFVWLKREVSPQLRDEIFRLGIPGIDFLMESKRFYPGGHEAAHILGAVNIDNQGIAGVERNMDEESVALLQSIGLARDRALEPVSLSIDTRVQHVMQDTLADSLVRYQAIAAAGVMIDVRTGEILAMASLPDFDPNQPASALKEGTFNRITAGKFELGSTFKTVTMAAALDAGAVKMTDTFDARYGIRFGRFLIDDFHGKHRVLTLPEVFKYSSNIGTIRAMQALGRDNYRAFLTRIGFDDPLTIEVPEKTRSVIPKQFSEISAATASFGHGLSITPLHMAAAVAAFANDGLYLPPTLYRRTQAEADRLARQVISPETSRNVRYLLRLNALEGSGTRANKFADGYRVGGKTGTAEKVVNGRYTSEKSLAVFVSTFPVDAPRYAMIILVDEPRNENAQSGRTAGWNAGEVTGRIVQRVAPMLGIAPAFGAEIDDNLVPAELRRASGLGELR